MDRSEGRTPATTDAACSRPSAAVIKADGWLRKLVARLAPGMCRAACGGWPTADSQKEKPLNPLTFEIVSQGEFVGPTSIKYWM